jgi:hypothetical protein
VCVTGALVTISSCALIMRVTRVVIAIHTTRGMPVPALDSQMNRTTVAWCGGTDANQPVILARAQRAIVATHARYLDTSRDALRE